MSTLTNSRASPGSDRSESGFGTLPMGEKAILKRNVNRQHNGNYRAGYVPVHEQVLPKTGLRGRKTYAFWTLVVLLFFLALGNLLLTFIILGVLRLGQGMESLELLPEESLVMFYGNTDLDRIYKRDGKLEGFDDSPVEITGDNSSVLISLIDKEGRNNPQISVDVNGTLISGVDSFEVHDPSTGQPVFSTGYPNFGLPRGVAHLNVKIAHTRRISSSVNSSLLFQSDSYARLKGNEGTRMEGREIVWSADQDIFLKSVNGSVVLSGHEGISLDIKSIPIVPGGRRADSTVTLHYKVCVCMPGGKLFRVPVPLGGNTYVGCHNVDLSPENNPCM
ncbi:hypothetical protein R5R35_013191 [Gryllus longicercus]|uniref:Beta-sarcoglycan n=1 Tax=Gryllus longicercus TaxID=2509291 RepID=A0AAN9V691_9ORTH|nr:Beta-sarcoglycan [Gryllus bimaculatus]